jgi:predicted nucleic acid-binding protein
MSGIAFDASVLINIVASGAAETILMALNGRLLVVDAVQDEIKFDPRDPEPRQPRQGVLTRFFEDGLLRPLKLSPEALDLFFELVQAPRPDNLGDGEAAAVAAAFHTGASVATDDSKAQRICRSQFPELEVVTSVDVFRDPSVVAALAGRLPEALLSAVSRGRMRVPKRDRPWARQVLQELAEHCPYI